MEQAGPKRIDMTEGIIWKQLLLYAVPLILGDLFQQLYNTVDSVIVGQAVGKSALAAVGATYSVINIVIGLFTGISTGATVVIARYFGARSMEQLHRAIQTTITLTLALSVLFTMVGVLSTPLLLRMLNTPADVYADARQYLLVYFAGVGGLILYNMCAGILRAVGDSRRPLYTLIFSACLNVGLDLLLVLGFRMGVIGAALATVIAQSVSALALLWLLCRTEDVYKLSLRELQIDKPIAKRIIGVGLPVGLQKSLVAASNTVVLSYINQFGAGAMAGWSVQHKLDDVTQKLNNSMSVAVTTFVSQNLGAKKEERVQRGVRIAMGLTLGVVAVCSALFILFRVQLIGLFNNDPEVLYFGSIMILGHISPAILSSVVQVRAGELRGRGKSKIPMLVMVLFYIVFRQTYLALIWPSCKNLYAVLACFPLSWIFSGITLRVLAKKYARSAENMERTTNAA